MEIVDGYFSLTFNELNRLIEDRKEATLRSMTIPSLKKLLGCQSGESASMTSSKFNEQKTM